MKIWAFENPWWLLALLALALVAVARRWRRVAVFVVPHAAAWSRGAATPPAPWPAAMAYLGLGLLAVAMARPQWIEEKDPEKRPGHDFVLAIDLSTSMYAEDFLTDGRTLNRLQTVKPIIEAFINRRPNDRISVVVFAGRAYTFSPLTFDHDWLRRQTAHLTIGAIEDGTAIGDAIGVALNRLQQGARTDGPERLGSFIVLLTDGASNRGDLDPRQVSALATEKGIPIYTIGAGVGGMVPMPVFDREGRRTGTELKKSEIDGLLLRDLAERTNGLYFPASDTAAIQAAFAAIDRAEQVEFEAPALRVTTELFTWFLAPGLPCLGLALLGAVLQARKGAS